MDAAMTKSVSRSGKTPVRPSAKQAVAALNARGVEVAMLTGENRATAERVAAGMLAGAGRVLLADQKPVGEGETSACGTLVAVLERVADAQALDQVFPNSDRRMSRSYTVMARQAAERHVARPHCRRVYNCRISIFEQRVMATLKPSTLMVMCNAPQLEGAA